MAWSDEARRASAEARKASAKAKETGKPDDHLKAQLAHEAAARAHQASGPKLNLGGTSAHDVAADHHTKMAEEHEKQRETERMNKIAEDDQDKRVVRAFGARQASDEDRAKSLTTQHDAKIASQDARAATSKASRSGKPELHEEAADRHEVAAGINRTVGNTVKAQMHDKIAASHREKATEDRSEALRHAAATKVFPRIKKNYKTRDDDHNEGGRGRGSD